MLTTGCSQPSKVAVIRCDSYDTGEVEKAIARGMAILGDISDIFHPGETVLIKPNLLQAARPEKAVCVHPEVFRAVATYCLKQRVKLTYGDSPAMANPGYAARVSGLADVAASMDISFADFKSSRSVSAPENCHIKKFDLAAGVLDADCIISISKLKTHAFTTMTGAVKNLLGCVPGLRKAEFHVRFPDPDSFSLMLVELALTVKAKLHIMDGIIGMEGEGPSSGSPRNMNVLLLSRDPVALDAVASRIIGLSAGEIAVLKYGQQLGLGSVENYQTAGDDIHSFHVQQFKRPSIRYHQHDSRAVRLIRKWILTKMHIDQSRCTHCGQCVAICPVNPKAIVIKQAAHPPSYSSALCIRCMCCQEVCPEHAIRFVTPLAGRLLHRLSRN